jgi:hypothetical protein
LDRYSVPPVSRVSFASCISNWQPRWKTPAGNGRRSCRR